MDDRYRLVFRGEVLDGQHRAVVQKRLAEALNLDEARTSALFSGKTVVLKREADAKTAARFQALFKKAGGRLRILPVEGSASEAQQTPDEPDSALPAAESAATAGASQYTVLSNYSPPPAAPRIEIDAPDFAIAEPGSLLVEPAGRASVEVPEVVFDLAERGADLLPQPPAKKVVELGPLDFELAEVGSELGEARKPVEAVAPDISHLKLVDA